MLSIIVSTVLVKGRDDSTVQLQARIKVGLVASLVCGLQHNTRAVIGLVSLKGDGYWAVGTPSMHVDELLWEYDTLCLEQYMVDFFTSRRI